MTESPLTDYQTLKTDVLASLREVAGLAEDAGAASLAKMPDGDTAVDRPRTAKTLGRRVRATVRRPVNAPDDQPTGSVIRRRSRTATPADGTDQTSPPGTAPEADPEGT